jgi:hypothetical protein
VKRKSLALARKEEPDAYEYYDIYCGVRPAEEVQDYRGEKVAVSTRFERQTVHDLLQASAQPDEQKEGVFDMDIQEDMCFRIQNVESKREFSSDHPLLANTDFFIKNPKAMADTFVQESPRTSLRRSTTRGSRVSLAEDPVARVSIL